MITKTYIGRILYRIVLIQINRNLFAHQGKFKIGDIVTWNWKALIVISFCVKDRPGCFKIIDIIKYKDSDGLVFKDIKHGGTTGGDAFWYRKSYFWEKEEKPKKILMTKEEYYTKT